MLTSEYRIRISIPSNSLSNGQIFLLSVCNLLLTILDMENLPWIFFQLIWKNSVMYDNNRNMCDVQIESCKTCKMTVYTTEPVLMATTESVDALHELGYTPRSTHTPCPPSD